MAIHRAIPAASGMTRKMFIPMSHTLLGTSDYVDEVDNWVIGMVSSFMQ